MLLSRYELFHHNCNNFSHETAQFLVGRGIPQHIVDLPGEILATPMGQMLAPMLQQAFGGAAGQTRDIVRRAISTVQAHL